MKKENDVSEALDTAYELAMPICERNYKRFLTALGTDKGRWKAELKMLGDKEIERFVILAYLDATTQTLLGMSKALGTPEFKEGFKLGIEVEEAEMKGRKH